MVIAFVLGTLWCVLLIMVFHVLFGGVGRVLRRRRRSTFRRTRRFARRRARDDGVVVDLPLSRRSPD